MFTLNIILSIGLFTISLVIINLRLFFGDLIVVLNILENLFGK